MSDVKLSSRLRVASILTEPEETSRLLENAANRIEELERELATAKAEQRKRDAELLRSFKCVSEDIANAIERGE